MGNPYSMVHVVVVIFAVLVHQSYSFPYRVSDDWDNNADKPVVGISHQMICQNAVTELARDTEIQKRDDAFINLVINVCFPDTDTTVLLQLLATISGQLPVGTTKAPWENQWDFGLLPEVQSGQEGIDENDFDNDVEQDPELIGGLPAELGPGQEGIDAGGNAGEDAGVVPDSPNWWNGEFVGDSNTDMDNEVPNAPAKKNRLVELISFVLNNMFDNEVNDLLSQFENDSGSSSSSSSEEEIPATTKQTIPNTEMPITTKVKTESPSTIKVTTQPPTTKIPTELPTTKILTTTKVATEKVATKAPAMEPSTDGVTTGGPTQPPLPNPNKKSDDDMILELLLRYAKKMMKKSDHL